MNDQHRSLREQLGVYALGHGTPAERAAVRAHLEGCAGCRAELAAVEPVARRLDAADPAHLDLPPAPPSGLEDLVLAGIAREEAAARAVVPRPRRRVAALAVAGLGLAACAAAAGWFARPVPDLGPLEPVAVQVAAGDVEATADLVPHTWGMEVRLTGDGFTAGEVYHVMVQEDDGAEVTAGEFLGVGPAELRCNLNSSVLRTHATGFTVLDASGDVVITSSF